MELLSKARKIFSADRYATELTGVSIDHVGDHKASCSLPLDGRHCNARGTAMGGVLFTLADFCAAVASNSDSLDSGELCWVSLNSTIHFLAPAVGNLLIARCTALKSGRTTALYQTKIESPDDGKVIAIVETSMIRA